jgi:cyclophilin family peptidyl-prolyl cis-trans isomerase/plastocyanin
MRRVLVLLILASMILPLSSRAQATEYEVGQQLEVQVQFANVYSSPSWGAPIIAILNRGDHVTIQSDSSDQEKTRWLEIELERLGIVGWIPEAALVRAEVIGTDSFDQLPTDCWATDQSDEQPGAPAWSDAPAMVIDPTVDYIATISTEIGDIVIELDPEQAPIATNNFYCLASAGYYDGTEFHRISADFLIQGVDPTGTGTGMPGYVVPSDPTTGPYPAGSLALANRDPDENGAQFFIAVTDLTGQIPDEYPVFGQVISGMDVVSEISQGAVELNPRGELSAPQDPVTILNIEVGIVEEELGPALPTPSPTSSPSPPPTPTLVPSPTPRPTQEASQTAVIGTGITLIAKDIAFDPKTMMIQASELPTTIIMENTGAAVHDFVIDELDLKVTANPGETVEFEIPAGTAAGEYQFYCSIPGHKEAGMTGTLTVVGTAASSQAKPGNAASCEGFADYQDAVERAEVSLVAQHPDVMEVFAKYWDLEDEEVFEAMTSDELRALGAFFASYATALSGITPPDFALAWHENQIEIYFLLAEVLETTALSNFFTAALLYGTEFDQLEVEEEIALMQASGCPAFVAWATEDDEDDWSQASMNSALLALGTFETSRHA